MGGWLPPGCTDKDIDDAINGPEEMTDAINDLETFQDMRREAMWIERTMHDIETNCDEMIGRGYGDELRDLLDKIRNEHWPYREAAE